jgi:hypothetical protein
VSDWPGRILAAWATLLTVLLIVLAGWTAAGYPMPG